ncbi:Ig-like domain-containing protein [Bacteroides sp. UBA939]|uniref:Ig-like domain-containing protein n=1 Tax=Bacteroides sp. UBA939 TaxID=1946092 RepID=UPI0025BBDF9D|nr:Ig-like domain-containing protein [Bacteroides sp. UBA939]
MMKIFFRISCFCILLTLGFVAGSCEDDKDVNPVIVTSLSFANTNEENVVALIEGDSWTPQMTLLPDNSVDKDAYTFSYTSSNEAVFTVDENGTVTAKGVGEAALTVWSTNNRDMWASCIISVEERIHPVTSIEIPEDYREYYLSVNGSLNLGGLIRVLPENATNPEVIYSSSASDVATVNSYGEVYAMGLGDATITVRAVDGSGVSVACNVHVREVSYVDLDRAGWSVTTSHPYSPDAAAVGTPESLIDDNMSTCLVLVKAGKTLNGITVGVDESVFFVIDMQNTNTFDYFRLRHRTTNTSANLRVNKVSVYGSNNGEDFTEVAANVTIATNVNEVTVLLPSVNNFRYFKLAYEGWINSGNSIQISDFNIGKMGFLD